MENETKKNDFLLPASIIIAGVMVAGSIIYLVGSKNTGVSPNPRAESNPNTQVANIASILEPKSEDVILGQPEAKVTLVEYGDYQCPFCKIMFDETEGQIRKEYIETGKVKMVYRDFPIDSRHPFARAAAEAANCAKDQGKFWTYHDALFAKQKEIPTLDFVALATGLELDGEAFKECLESGKYKDKIQKDLDGGAGAGVNGTPATFINGQLVSGAQPYAVFKQAIEQALTAN